MENKMYYILEKLKNNKKYITIALLLIVSVSATFLATRHFYVVTKKVTLTLTINNNRLYMDEVALHECFVSYVLLATSIKDYEVHSSEVNKRLNSINRITYSSNNAYDLNSLRKVNYLNRMKTDDLNRLKRFRLNALCSVQLHFDYVSRTLKTEIADYDCDSDKLECDIVISTAKDYSTSCEKIMLALTNNNYNNLDYYKAQAQTQNSFKCFATSAKYFFSANESFLRPHNKKQLIDNLEAKFKKEIDKYSAGSRMFPYEIIPAEMYFTLKGLPLKDYTDT